MVFCHNAQKRCKVSDFYYYGKILWGFSCCNFQKKLLKISALYLSSTFF